MAKINWTAEAELWLHDIFDYIADDNQTIDILGVFHGAMEIDRHLK